MNTKLLPSFAFALFACVWSRLPAQPKPPEHWEKEIAELEAGRKTTPPEIGSVLFIGSSSIRLWTSLAQDFPGVASVNHGFGGSTIADSVHYFDRLVKPVKPRVVVFYAGGNDLAGGKTPEDVSADLRGFAEKLHATFPFARLVVTSLRLTPARWATREKFALTNAYFAAFCAADPRRTFLDLNSAMLDANGQPRLELYGEDRLHMTSAGYAIWIRLLAPHIDWRSTRFEKDILAFESADREKPAPLGGVLFTGASSIKLWTSLEQDFPGVPIINRGFGGAFMMDCVHYFNRLVPPYSPRLVVLSAGGNDLAFGHRTPEEIAADLNRFAQRMRAGFPRTRLVVLSSGHSPLRWDTRSQINRLNELLVAVCAAHPLCVFVDLNKAMLTADGQLRPELYRADRLHLTDAGYAIWRKELTPFIK